MKIQIEDKISHYKDKLAELLNQSPVKVSEILKNKERFRFIGIYIISDSNDKLIYVGSTKTSMFDRMKQHKQQNTTSDLNEMINYYQLECKDCLKYLVRCMPIDNRREIMLLENFAISILNPRCNK